MKKILATALLGFGLLAGSASAQVYVRVGPPAARFEHRPFAPSPRHVWVGGYYRWDGGRYAWAPGYWVVPPRPHAVWVAGHWRQERRGWFWVEGHWRG